MTTLRALYGETIREHARHPRNFGFLPDPDLAHEDVNHLCGDRIRIELRLDGWERVAEARFRGDSCAISRAAASLLTDMIRQQSLREVEALPEQALIISLNADIRPARIQCALLPLHVLRAGIAAYRGRAGQ